MTVYSRKPLRVASVIPRLTAGGIGPVCRDAAEALAKRTGWQVTLLCLHGPPSESERVGDGFHIIQLGLDGNCARLFLDWLAANPQDLIITNDVSRIEPAFPFLASTTRHLIQLHDSGRRYRAAAVRQVPWVDGMICVGRHIEAPLRRSLDAVGFRGLLRTVHNGANFPPFKPRASYRGPLRLLFLGRMDAFKGVFDLVPLLARLKQMGVPGRLNLVGGENETLRRQFQRSGLTGMVTWTGHVPHARCYDIAAQSDLLMMLSRKEPFGMVTIEAMSMGCVPMAYDVPSGSTEIIEHGKSGLLVPIGDLRAWAEHVHRLHQDRLLLGELSAGAIARSRQHFSAEVTARNLAAFLRDVMDHAAQHPARRETRLRPEEPMVYARPARGYQRLPAGLRLWIRNWVCASPRLSYWLLNR